MSSTLSRKPPKAVLWGKLAWHPAAAAWTAFGAGAAEPESIEVLRNGKKAGTYRLVGAGPADMKTEAAILEAMDRLMEGRTAFLVTHRSSALATCDRRLQLERGRLLEAAPSLAWQPH